MRSVPALRSTLASAALTLSLAAAPGCAVPVTAERVGPDEVYVSVHESVLDPGDPSVAAHLVLERADLLEAWEADPATALVELHGRALRFDTRERLYGLAELSLAEGMRTDERRWFLGSAVYSWLFLFGAADRPPPDAFDPRFRLACDIYARAVAEAFRDEEDAFVPAAGRFDLPIGSIDVVVPSDHVMVGTVEFRDFVPADDFEVHGIRTRVRRDGLGVPLIAMIPQEVAASRPPGPPQLPMVPRTAANALLVVEGDLGDVASGALRATLSLTRSMDVAAAEVRGAKVPLAADITAPIAHGLTTSKVWDFELFGYLSRDEAEFPNGVVLAQPYQRGKIPILLVHGTASSPARWADLANELWADPVVAERCQIWLFIYSTGPPILASAQSLRESLAGTIAAVDPQGTDEALRRMVVIGHSQGGLLTRLLVTDSGDRFWSNVSDRPFEEFEMTEDERRMLGSAIFFERVPNVERVVFVCTPHRGSYIAGNWMGKIGSWLISLPKTLTREMSDIVQRNFAKMRGDVIGGLPTAVDNMAPGSPFCEALADCPIATGVRVHSIVAVDGDGPPEELDDGVVAYESAHFPAAESEILVRFPHSAQGHPRTILEIRRILREHVATTAPPAPKPEGGPAKAEPPR